MEHGTRKIKLVENVTIHGVHRNVYKNGDKLGVIRLYKNDNVKLYDLITNDISITFNDKNELYNYLDLYKYELNRKKIVNKEFINYRGTLYQFFESLLYFYPYIDLYNSYDNWREILNKGYMVLSIDEDNIYKIIVYFNVIERASVENIENTIIQIKEITTY